MIRIARASLVAASLLGLTACTMAAGDETADYLIDRAMGSIADGQYALAETDLNRALELDPGNPAAMLDLGVVYQRTGRVQQADSMYRRVMEADADGVPALVSHESGEGQSYEGLAAQNLASLPPH